MSYGIDRAIQQGIDSARSYRKDGEGPYHDLHPLFMFWFSAVVKKSDCRDWTDSRIRKAVLAEVKWRGVG